MHTLASLLRTVKGYRPCGRHLFLLSAVVLLIAFWCDYRRTLVPFTIVFGGRSYQEWTHQKTVEGALFDAGLRLAPRDLVQPDRNAPLVPNLTVQVERAAAVLIEADGRVVQWRTHARTPSAILAEVDIPVGQHDEIWVEGRPYPKNESLSHLSADDVEAGSVFDLWQSPWERPEPAPVRVVLKRAATLYVDNGGVPSTLYTTATTIAEALREHDIILYLGDRVNPNLGSRVANGLRIYIQRSKAIELMVDGRSTRTRTRAANVADALAQQSVALVGLDVVEPPESAPIQEGMGIRVNRVSNASLIEQDAIPFETVWRPAPDIELDQQRLEQEGHEGLNKRRIEVVYRDGQEVQRQVADEWTESEPETKIIAYGTRIVPRVVDTESGQLTYWRKVRMLATSYTAASSGKAPDDPQYGMTRSGLSVGRGVVAVDSAVVGLGDRLYIPGYGLATAGDTGGGIKGRRIDLGYSEDELVRWYRWVDVFLLGPPPPSEHIRWVLPNWPRERR